MGLRSRIGLLAALASMLAGCGLSKGGGDDGPPVTTANPILFVTQVPLATDFLNLASVFGNQNPTTHSAPRGGDLWIRYEDGTLRNLTADAGLGATGVFQGTAAIAVREPCVHWSGTKALFSMVIGAPTSP